VASNISLAIHDGALRGPGVRGRAVQVDPINPKLKPPGTKRLKLKCGTLLSTFAFKFNSRRYTVVKAAEHATTAAMDAGRGLPSPTSHLNLSRFRHTSACPPV